MKTVVSFDFDDTLAYEKSMGWGDKLFLANPKYVGLLEEYHALGCKCIILTARSPDGDSPQLIEDFLISEGIKPCVTEVVYTSHQLKGPYAVKHGVSLHYDDKDSHVASVREHGIQAVKVETTEELCLS
jgi:acid phosphatase class B